MEKNLHQKEISVKIRKDEPIEVYGLTLYPLTMEHYEEFMNMKNVLSIRLSALPVQYMAYDYLNAIFRMDIDNRINKKDKHDSLFSTVLYLFELALRIAPEQMEKSIKIYLTKDHLIDQISVMQNGKLVFLKSNEFSKKIRPVIASQNCVELPDESANKDLIEAGIQKREFYSQNEPDIVFDVEKMVSSVAYLSHVREKEIYEWTIREFENRKQAIDRDKHYTMYSQAEMSGFVKFKKGNPFPSWCFDKKSDKIGAMSLDEVQKTFGNTTQKS